MLIVDAANVVGSRPDGWWRDRAGAARRLVDAVRAAVGAGRVAGPAVVVLEGAARAGAPEGSSGGVRVVHAAAEGDETVVALVVAAGGAAVGGAAGGAGGAEAAAVGGARGAGAGDPAGGVAGGAEGGAVTVVTADRALAARVREAGADVVGPRWLLDRLGG